MALFLLVTRDGLTGNHSKTAVLLGFSAIRCARSSRNNSTGPGQHPIPNALRYGLPHADGVVVKPLSDTSLWLQHMRDPESR
jgi:hypothetical protein